MHRNVLRRQVPSRRAVPQPLQRYSRHRRPRLCGRGMHRHLPRSLRLSVAAAAVAAAAGTATTVAAAVAAVAALASALFAPAAIAAAA